MHKSKEIRERERGGGGTASIRTDRQTDRQTDRERERERERERGTLRQTDRRTASMRTGRQTA